MPERLPSGQPTPRPPLSTSVDAVGDLGPLQRLGRRINGWLSHFVVHHTSLEWLIGLVIMLVWAVIAFVTYGLIAGVAAIIFGLVLHFVAMETGSHVWLWLATAVVLVYAIVAYNTVLESVGPVALAIGGASALSYNESVRINYARRRNAVIDPSVFASSTISVAIATVTGVVGIGIAVMVSNQIERNWMWMPAAAVTVIAVAYTLVIVPTIRAPQTSHQRWEPGSRIPPQPLGTDARSASIPPEQPYHAYRSQADPNSQAAVGGQAGSPPPPQSHEFRRL